MAKRTDRFESKAGRVVKVILKTVVTLVSAALIVAGNTALPSYGRIVNALTGLRVAAWDNSAVDIEGLDLDYYKADYETAEEGAALQADFNLRLAQEGYILLQNDERALPLPEGATLSFFSENFTNLTAAQSIATQFLGTSTVDFTAFTEAFAAEGLNVNTTLADFYATGAGAAYNMGPGSISFGASEDFRINECPLSELEAAEGVLDSCTGTVPVFVYRRVAGEGRDMPRGMSGHADNAEDQARSYLEPDSTELEILQYLNDNFDTVIVLVNTASPVELGWVADFPSIKAVVSAPNAGSLEALAGIFSGSVNPSGHTVDTFVTDALDAPASQNVGDYQYVDEYGELTGINYVTYAEGIYVGYRYYETRYEDAVLGQGNAGDFDYDEAVVYPFGHGLSYTTFVWSDFSIAEKGDQIEATVTVTNTGDVAGRDAVEIYAQSPYTDYDRENGVEKASVVLVGYDKTRLLEPGESQTMTIVFAREQLKSYDANGAGTYIMDDGTYYVTAGMDAHAAVQNVLAAKGAAVDGDAALVDSFVVAAFDAETYSVDSATGARIENQFDYASQDDTVYLTRADWEGTFPAHDGEPIVGEVSTWGNEINASDGVAYIYGKEADAVLIAAVESTDSGNPDVSDAASTVVTGADNGLTLIEMRGLDYDDPQWDLLLDQLTLDDYNLAINRGGYGTPALESVGKPWGYDADTAAGLVWGGSGMMYVGPVVCAQTWNPALAHEYGLMIGNDASVGGACGWYAPSMNMHRTPYVGRAGEYYSEDPFIAGRTASQMVLGAAERGVYSTIKHFALNDQENHRGDSDAQNPESRRGAIVTWANEQSIREIYLVPFEMCVKVDGGTIESSYVNMAEDGSLSMDTYEHPVALGVMSSFNRIGTTWAGGDYRLITGVLRNEWGFNGWVITDSAAGGQPHMDAQQMIEAGADVKLCYTVQPIPDIEITAATSEGDMQAAREAMHHLLYAIVNSKAMEGAAPGSVMHDPLQNADIIRMGLTGFGSLGIILVVVSEIRHHIKKKAWKAERAS